LADAPDKGVRDNTVSLIGEFYTHLQEDIWRFLGNLNPKVQGLFEARIKKIKGPEAPSLGSSVSSAALHKSGGPRG